MLPFIADGEAALSENLSDIIHSSLGSFGAAWFRNLSRWGRGVLLVLLRLGLGGSHPGFELGRFGESLRIGIPRGKGLGVDGAPGYQPVGHGSFEVGGALGRRGAT